MLPSDAKLTGPSYVLESNALERPKFTYKYFDLYLGEEDRGDKDVYLLTLIEGSMKKI